MSIFAASRQLLVALLPNVRNLRALSAVVAEAMYAVAHADGVATKKPDNVVQAIADTVWQPAYDAGKGQ